MAGAWHLITAVSGVSEATILALDQKSIKTLPFALKLSIIELHQFLLLRLSTTALHHLTIHHALHYRSDIVVGRDCWAGKQCSW
jgi:hypothetical protein